MSGEHTLQTLETASGAVDIPRSAVYRYMGLRGSEPGAELSALTEACLAEFRTAVYYRACYLVLPVRLTERGVDFGSFFAPGRSLVKNLSGCGEAVLFVATTGMEAELRRKRAAAVSPARALALDAVGTAAVEAFCDALCDRWRAEFAPRRLRPRFSPGYGDLPLEVQRPLLACLDSGRRVGVTLTESLLMMPQKSVSAIVGIGVAGCAEQTHDCTQCGKTDCEFRL